jgi:hypothetical protein
MRTRGGCALAQDIHVRRVLIASDCRNMVTSIEQGTLGSYAHIVQEIDDSRKVF